MRHGVVGEAEQHAVERLGSDIFGGVVLYRVDIAPLLPLAQLACFRQHAGRQIDAIDPSAGSDRLVQVGEIASGAAADLEHAVARLQCQALRRLAAEMRGNKE